MKGKKMLVTALVVVVCMLFAMSVSCFAMELNLTSLLGGLTGSGDGWQMTFQKPYSTITLQLSGGSLQVLLDYDRLGDNDILVSADGTATVSLPDGVTLLNVLFGSWDNSLLVSYHLDLSMTGEETELSSADLTASFEGSVNTATQEGSFQAVMDGSTDRIVSTSLGNVDLYAWAKGSMDGSGAAQLGDGSMGADARVGVMTPWGDISFDITADQYQTDVNFSADLDNLLQIYYGPMPE